MPAHRVPAGEQISFTNGFHEHDPSENQQLAEQENMKDDVGGLDNQGFTPDIEDEQEGTEGWSDSDEASLTTFNRSNTYTVKRERKRERVSDLRDPRDLLDSENLKKDHRVLPFPLCRDLNCPHQKGRGLPAPPGFPQGLSAPLHHSFGAHSSFFSSSLYGPSPYSWPSSSPSSLPQKLSQSSSSPSTLPIKTSASRSHSPSLPPFYPVVTLPKSQRRSSSMASIKTSISMRKTSLTGKASSLFLCWGRRKSKETPESFQMTPPPSRSNYSCTSSCSCSTCSCSSCSSSLHLQMPPQPQTYPHPRRQQRHWYRCDLTCFIVSAFVALSCAGIAALILYLHLFAWPSAQI